MGKLAQFSQGLDPGPAQGLTWASPGLDPGQPRSIFWSRFWSNRTTETTAFTATPKGRARPFVLSVPAVASVLAVSVSVVCDQVDQVVPAHQVDDINEVHELDPVHQVDHKDEYTSPHITSHHITS